MAKEKVLIIPDIQVPFEHPDTIPFLKAVEKLVNPTRIVQIGDLIDSHALSQYESDPDGMSAGDELRATIKHLRKFYKAFPEVTVTLGNHDDRLHRLAFSAGVPRSCVRDLPDILEFPSHWRLVDELIIDGVVYEHGEELGS